MKIDNKQLTKFLSHCIVDLLVIAAIVYVVHFIFYYPSIIVFLMMLAMVTVRYEDYQGTIIIKDDDPDDHIYDEPFGDCPHDPSKQ